MRFLVLILLLTACTSAYVHTKGPVLVANGQPLQIRGINLANWLVPEGYMLGLKNEGPRQIESLITELAGPTDAIDFWRQYRDSYITEADIRFIHDSGFNAIRVPLHYKFFETDDAEGFRLLDRLTAWAAKYNLYVIPDLHCAPGGQTGSNIDDSYGYQWLFASEPSQRATIALWKRIATHYRNNPTILGYDLLNEPIPSFPPLTLYNPQLEPLYQQITTAIRETDTHHIIILGGAQWNSNFDVFAPPFDANTMYTFHYYWKPPTQAAMQPYLSFRARHKIPLLMGESGENTNAWVQDFAALMESNHIGWAYWPYKKMGNAAAVTTIAPPIHWKEITRFAARKPTTDDKRLTQRPPQEHIREALADLLVKIRLENTHVNQGYLKALIH